MEYFKNLKAIRTLVFATALVLPYFTAFSVEELLKSHYFKNLSGSFFSVAKAYQSLLTAGTRELRQNYTILVEDNITASGDVCDEKNGRAKLAELLNIINEQKPAVIAIDYYFTHSCDDDPYGTTKLKETMLAISKETPVIIGRMYGNNTEKNELATSDKQLQFNDNAPNLPIEGIINFDKDNRKIPLRWSARNDAISPEKTIDSLSLASVKAYYKSLALNPPQKLQEIIESRKNPYISFIKPDELISLPASAIFLDATDNLAKLRGKIVILGDTKDERDQHESVFSKRLPGLKLHANYIEAMLDQRYFVSFEFADILFAFALFFILNFSLSKISSACKNNIFKVIPIFVFISLTLALIFSTLIVCVALFSIYIDPFLLSYEAFVITVGHQFLHNKQSH